MNIPAEQERALLIRDKYAGDKDADLADDLRRLSEGEPLAYVIGWVPFLGLRIRLDTRPLIPRPETEWWTEELCAHLSERFADAPVRVLDLCAGSGAIGLAVLARVPGAHVSFGELMPEHAELIRLNLDENGLDAARATIRSDDLFEPFLSERFDIIVTNPPYIPSERVLDESVTGYEPPEALYAGSDGLEVIRRIATDVPQHLNHAGEVWIECDIDNGAETAKLLSENHATKTEIRTDPYGRPRLCVGYYP